MSHLKEIDARSYNMNKLFLLIKYIKINLNYAIKIFFSHICVDYNLVHVAIALTFRPLFYATSAFVCILGYHLSYNFTKSLNN